MSILGAKSRPARVVDPAEVFASGGLPAVESPRRRLTIQLVALLALAVSIAYVSWRAAVTLNLHAWWLSVPLWILEVHAVIGLVLFTANLWDVDAGPRSVPVDDFAGTVAVLIPTYDEGMEVLLPSVAAAVALQPAHTTYVLDDGRRPWVADLCRDLGAEYVTRADNAHAKAGNLNAALEWIDADVVAVLDADHVASPNLLRHTLGYFDDPRVALVQTPQDFYNVDSFEHVPSRAGRYSEQALFYRVVQAGRNRWHAAFWCGTGAVLRTEALRDAGGIATETVTEDIHTSMRMHRRGWRSVYHNEVLARGLAAADVSQYLTQRVRWGTGAMQVLRTDTPARRPGLTFMQRVSYLTTLLGWFDSWRTLGYLVLPVAVLFTGANPIAAPGLVFLAWFLPTFLVQRVALSVLSRGRAPQLKATVFELARMPANLRATLTIVSRRPRPFRVTPKGRQGDERRRFHAPALLTTLQVGSVLTAVWYLGSRFGLTPLHYGSQWSADGAACWLGLNAALLTAAVRRAASPRFASERRAAVRFAARTAAHLDGVPAVARDLSLTGAQLLCDDAIDADRPHRLTLHLGDEDLAMDVQPRTTAPALFGQTVVGVEYLPGQAEARAALALALFRHNVEREVTAEAAGAPQIPAQAPSPAVTAAAVPAVVPAPVLATVPAVLSPLAVEVPLAPVPAPSAVAATMEVALTPSAVAALDVIPVRSQRLRPWARTG